MCWLGGLRPLTMVRSSPRDCPVVAEPGLPSIVGRTHLCCAPIVSDLVSQLSGPFHKSMWSWGPYNIRVEDESDALPLPRLSSPIYADRCSGTATTGPAPNDGAALRAARQAGAVARRRADREQRGR